MANRKNGNKTWVFGAVVGAVAGAAYALWKTPMSGDELRSKLSTGPVNQNDTAVSDTVHTTGFGGKILSTVEHTLAPIVGVELGKTANQNGKADTTPAAEKPAAAVATPQEENSANTENSAAPAGTGFTGSIRANRFAWGEPAPETAAEVAQPAASEPEVAAPVVPPAQPAVVTTPGSSGNYGTESIRAKRFAWGEPAPEADASKASTTTAEPAVATASATETNPLEPATGETSESGLTMRKFPKLGGLES